MKGRYYGTYRKILEVIQGNTTKICIVNLITQMNLTNSWIQITEPDTRINRKF